MSSKIISREEGGLVSMSSSQVVELDEVVANSLLITKDRLQTIFDSSGVTFQDCIVAMVVHETLNRWSTEYNG